MEGMLQILYPGNGIGGEDVGAKVRHDATQSVNNATVTPINWNTEEWDTDAFHDTVTNNTRITIPSGKGGKYYFIAWLSYVSNSSGSRQVIIRKNGSIFVAQAIAQAVNGDATTMVAFTELEVSAGDYFEVCAYQTSGGSLTVSTNLAFVFFSARKVDKAG